MRKRRVLMVAIGVVLLAVGAMLAGTYWPGALAAVCLGSALALAGAPWERRLRGRPALTTVARALGLPCAVPYKGQVDRVLDCLYLKDGDSACACHPSLVCLHLDTICAYRAKQAAQAYHCALPAGVTCEWRRPGVRGCDAPEGTPCAATAIDGIGTRAGTGCQFDLVTVPSPTQDEADAALNRALDHLGRCQKADQEACAPCPANPGTQVPMDLTMTYLPERCPHPDELARVGTMQQPQEGEDGR